MLNSQIRSKANIIRPDGLDTFDGWAMLKKVLSQLVRIERTISAHETCNRTCCLRAYRRLQSRRTQSTNRSSSRSQWRKDISSGYEMVGLAYDNASNLSPRKSLLQIFNLHHRKVFEKKRSILRLPLIFVHRVFSSRRLGISIVHRLVQALLSLPARRSKYIKHSAHSRHRMQEQAYPMVATSFTAAKKSQHSTSLTMFKKNHSTAL